MKKDIILAGVGGQGILSIAAVIGYAALSEKLYVKQSEVHGMSQRGGEVQAHLRISSEPIASDLIPMGKADMIISMEPMEALRYLPFLRREGWIISNQNPYENISNYPSLEKVRKAILDFDNHRLMDADNLARKAGSAKASNIVLLGASLDLLEISQEYIRNAIDYLFKNKGPKVLETNVKALDIGIDLFSTEIAHA
jgi:indolepyruvate ferredoxin oxidoreductase beta subunit